MQAIAEHPPRAPTVGLDGLGDLLSHARAAGVDVSLEVGGDRRPLPASVDLAAFRIVQESLTNVVRHAGASAADVQLRYADGELTVQVEDDGHGHAAPAIAGSGSALAGMRERAAALGGRLDAGPRPGGGFRVRARLPLGSER